MSVEKEIAALEMPQWEFTPEQRRRVYLLYARVKLQVGDMHGVSDIANDVRVHDAEQLAPGQVPRCQCVLDGMQCCRYKGHHNKHVFADD